MRKHFAPKDGSGKTPHLADMGALLKKSYHFGKDDSAMLIKANVIVQGVAIAEFNGRRYVTRIAANFFLR